MADFPQFSGSEEENAEIKRLNAEVVSFLGPRGIQMQASGINTFVRALPGQLDLC